MGSTIVLGPGRRAAYALAVIPFPEDATSRITLRALLPRSTSGPNGDNVSGGLRRWLRFAEARGQIKRGELFIVAKDREALFHNATEGLSRFDMRDFLCPEDAIELVAARIRTEENGALAARLCVELEILEQLASS